MTFTVTINELLPGLNGSAGHIRGHFAEAKKIKDRMFWLVKEQQKGVTFVKAQVAIVCTRYYAVHPMDLDNAASSFKHLLDAIVKAGIIWDDSPTYIVEGVFRQVKVEKKIEQKMTVEITSID